MPRKYEHQQATRVIDRMLEERGEEQLETFRRQMAEMLKREQARPEPRSIDTHSNHIRRRIFDA
jgi:hypothetical protein